MLHVDLIDSANGPLDKRHLAIIVMSINGFGEREHLEPLEPCLLGLAHLNIR